MPTPYIGNCTVHFSKGIITWISRRGVLLPNYSMLTILGRKSGKAYSLPVIVIEKEGQRWLVSPYGEVNWVINARAGSKVTLLRAAKSETVHSRELEPEESAPVLKEYNTRVPITRSYFEVAFDASVQGFVNIAPLHPVFQIQPAG